MKKRYFWLLLFLTLHVSSFANECKVINAACSGVWYPVSFLLPSNPKKATGVAVEIARAAAKELQLDIEFNCLLPWKRAEGYMNSGQVDMLVGHYLNQEREQNWLVSDGLFADDIRAVYLNKKLDIKKIEDLKGLVGVKPRGASFGTVIDEYTSGKVSGYKIGEVSGTKAMFRQLLTGRVDYILSEKKHVQGYSKLLDFTGVFKLSDSLSLNSVHISFSKISPCGQYLEQFNTLIKGYKASGLLDTLFEQAKNDFNKPQKINIEE